MKLTAVISLKDNYSKIMKEAAKNTSAFRSDVDKTKKAMDKAFKQEQQIKLDAKKARGEISRFEKSMAGLKDKAVKITARTELFFEQHKRVAAAVNKLTHAPAVITVKAKDMATSTITGIARASAGLIGVGAGIAATGTAAAAGIGLASLKGASNLELQQISMEHFIGINNKGKSQDQIKATSDKFLKDLIANANITPFETGEVIKSGTRAVGLSAGDTKQAMNLVKLAEDMASLTPDKTISDAMEALADLKNGEVERMKEFNFKVTQAQIQAAGGKMDNIKNSEGISLGQMFQGGSEKLGKSASGFWSTITGSIKTGITNMGKDSLELLKPELKKWADFFSGPGSDKLFKAGANMMSGVTKSVIAGAEKATDWINTKFLNNVDFQNIPTFKGKVKAVWGEIKDTLDSWWESDGKKMFSDFITNSSDFLKAAAPGIGKGAFEIGSQLCSGIWEGLQDQIDKHPELATLITTGAGAAAGASVGGPWGALIGGGVGLAGGAGVSISVKTDPERKIKQQADFLNRLHSGDPNTPLISGPTTLSAPKKAIGMRTIPWDNYPALLHQGERVLTAQEARQSDGGGKTPLVINLHLSKTDDPEANKLLALIRAALEQAGYNMAPGGAK